MIRVVLVDDHSSFREALTFMLDREEDLSVIGQAGTLAEARSLVYRIPIDVVLVDLELPDGYGLDLLPLIRQETPNAAALVLSGNARPESPARAVAAGAVGFLSKSVGTAEITVAIRRVAVGETLFTPAEAVALTREAMQYHAQMQGRRQALADLTRREREVLCGLAAGLDNKALAQRLCVSVETIRTHITSILRKLGVDSRLQAALIAVQHGIVDPDDLP